MPVFSNTSISIAICDDGPNDLNEMETMTKELLETEKISCGISRFLDATSLLSSIENGEKFDILLLDVMMENLNGMELAGSLRRILISDLIYIEPWDRGTRLVLADGECKASVKISELERLLPKQSFTVCYRTVLVNLAFVQSIRYCELTLKNGQTVPAANTGRRRSKKVFCVI